MIVEKSRTIGGVAKSYGLVPQTVGNWVNKWRKTHSGIEGEEMMAAQLAEYKKIKAEVREARMEIDFLKEVAAFLRGGSPGKNTIRVHPPRRRQLPDPFDAPLSGGVAFRLLRLAQQGYVENPETP